MKPTKPIKSTDQPGLFEPAQEASSAAGDAPFFAIHEFIDDSSAMGDAAHVDAAQHDAALHDADQHDRDRDESFYELADAAADAAIVATGPQSAEPRQTTPPSRPQAAVAQWPLQAHVDIDPEPMLMHDSDRGGAQDPSLDHAHESDHASAHSSSHDSSHALKHDTTAQPAKRFAHAGAQRSSSNSSSTDRSRSSRSGGGDDDDDTDLLRPPRRQGFTHDADRAAKRVLVVGWVFVAFITLAMLGLLGRVAQLQFDPPPRIAELIDSQKSTITVQGRRASLVDRMGRSMRSTQVAHKLFVDPQAIEDYSTFAEKLGYTLGIDPAMIDRKISARADKSYVVIDRRVSDETLEKFSQLHKLPGVGLDPYLVREYPTGAVASNVLGFVGDEGKGLDGLERVFNKELTGTPGKLTFFRDVRHRAVWVEPKGYRSPTDGKSVRLSMDMVIQQIAEDELEATIKQFNAKQGEIIVMAPRTGEVLAMANYPTFDPENMGKAKADQWRNRCVTDVYEPGSTFKPYVWAAAVEQKIATPSEMIDCHGGYYVSPGGRHLRDAHGYGMLSWEDVLVKSSNIGMAHIGLRMGSKRLYHSVKSFGFGKLPGSGLPGEVKGIVNPLNKWNPIFSPTSVPMGQEVGVTPLQMARAFCTLSNGGLSVMPTIRARDASDVAHTAPIVERVVSKRTADITKAALRRVVTEGTGKLANSPYYSLFGKTGTAQVPDKKHGGYLPGAYVGSFVCGAPVDDPQVVVICVIHLPEKSKGYYGGIIAAPAAKRVVEQTLVYMGVPPQQSDDETMSQPKLVRH
jgi:cell division protein FtsI (penicillin-binding protein 3)